MKRFLKSICVILVVSILLAVPVSAEGEASTYASSFFIDYSTYLYRVSGYRFEIWFEVAARNVMEELGVSEIKLQRSADGENWSTVITYTPAGNPQMLCENEGFHADCVYYAGTSGYEYRAFVTFYAKNSTGYAKRYVYAYPIN